MTFPPEIVILSKLSGEDGGTEGPEAIIARKLARGKNEKILKKVLDKGNEVWYSE